MTSGLQAAYTELTPLNLAQVVPTLAAMLGRQGTLLAAKDVASGKYVFVSDALVELLGVERSRLLGAADADLFDPALAMVLRAADQTAIATELPTVQDHRFEFQGQRCDFQVVRMLEGANQGSGRCLWSAWSNLLPQRQKETQLKLALEQLEQQQRANDSLRRELNDQALRDGPTGLYKRSHFEDQLRREVDLTNREHREFALVLIRVDPLNPKCLTFGEAAQVRIQEAMGRLLRSNTRAMDVSSRLEDNLFAVLLSGVGLATAHSRMEGLRRQAAAQIVLLDGNELGFSVSMGVASYPHTAQSIEALQVACEQAICDAQARGGNRLAMASIRLAEQPAS
jgi:diguanylate cyclase (GGDEF)-like protein